MSINSVCISGNLTRDPEIRTSASGTSIMHLGVAVNERRKSPQTGNWEDFPNFVDCTIFGKRADALSPWLSKGSKVVISGRLHWHQWTAKDGGKRSKLEVIVDEIDLMSKTQSGSSGVIAEADGYVARVAQKSPQTMQYGGDYLTNQQNSDQDAYQGEIPF